MISNPTHRPSSHLLVGQPLLGVTLKRLTKHVDQRGSFTEIYQQTWGNGILPSQWSIVQSEENVLRGMHLHQRHDEYFSLLQGRCLVGLHDIRPDSPTRNQSALYSLTDQDLSALIFPRGIIHGWYFFTPSIHVQAVSEAYSNYGDDDNWGCRWNDPTLGLGWEISAPILSERASQFPPLRVLKADLANTGFFD